MCMNGIKCLFLLKNMEEKKTNKQTNESFFIVSRLYHYHWSWVCQAFSDYQMQQMTSNFIEQFGFNDEEFADQDDVVEWVPPIHACLSISLLPPSLRLSLHPPTSPLSTHSRSADGAASGGTDWTISSQSPGLAEPLKRMLSGAPVRRLPGQRLTWGRLGRAFYSSLSPSLL